jgi:prepilin-type N-terminal cleavage/methylation domain-containing protein
MKKAFTLIEILVVIAILGLLMGTLVYYVGGNTESAHAAKCKTHLKSLASAVSSAIVTLSDEQYFPLAGSCETMSLGLHRGGDGRKYFGEIPGWISWNSDGKYAARPTSHSSSACWFVSAYEQDPETREYCITNGAVYKFVRNHETYLCPAHIKKMPGNKRPAWSYVMNGYFGYDKSEGSDSLNSDYYPGRRTSSVYAHSTLLFAELQWEDFIGVKVNTSESAGFENDCTLQYSANDGAEIIGFNHKMGNDVVAHVAYADCHVGVIRYPRNGMSEKDLEELTRLLCTGKEYEISNGTVRELTN